MEENIKSGKLKNIKFEGISGEDSDMQVNTMIIWLREKACLPERRCVQSNSVSKYICLGSVRTGSRCSLK